MHGYTENYELWSDSTLVDAILSGNGRALEYVLAVSCGPVFKRLCETYRPARMEPADLVQEVCLLLLKNDSKALRSFRAVNVETGRSCSLKTYIVTCAARLIKKKSEENLLEIDWTSALSDVDGNWIDVRDMTQPTEQLKMRVLEAIMALGSPQERLVILEYKIRGRSPEEVAQMLNQTSDTKGTVGNVYTICNRGLKNLRAILEEGDIYA